jgi:hypothetical protein
MPIHTPQYRRAQERLQSGLREAIRQRIGYVFGSARSFDIAREFTILEDDFKSALALIQMCLVD